MWIEVEVDIYGVITSLIRGKRGILCEINLLNGNVIYCKVSGENSDLIDDVLRSFKREEKVYLAGRLEKNTKTMKTRSFMITSIEELSEEEKNKRRRGRSVEELVAFWSSLVKGDKW